MIKLQDVLDEGERDYKAEYKKYGSSTKSKKYRAELNQYNRKKGTYGNGDGKDASHKGGKIVGFESQSKNRGRAEKSRLKKEASSEYGKSLDKIANDTKLKMISKKDRETLKKLAKLLKKEVHEAMFDATGIDWSDKMMWKWVSKALKTAGIKELKYTPMKSGWLGGKFIWGGFYKVQADKRTDVLPITVDKKGNIHLIVSPKKFIIGKVGKLPQVVTNLKDFKKSDLDVYESVNEAANKIADIRQILKTKKGKRIDSIFMDVETAEEVMKHYKSLGRGAKERLTKQKIQNIVKSVKKANESVNEEDIAMSKGVQKLMKIATDGYGKVGGTTVDSMSANLFKQVYNKTNAGLRERLNKMNEKQLINVLRRMWDKFGKNVSL